MRQVISHIVGVQQAFPVDGVRDPFLFSFILEEVRHLILYQRRFSELVSETANNVRQEGSKESSWVLGFTLQGGAAL